MRAYLCRLTAIAVLLAAVVVLAGCIVVPPRRAHYREPVRVVHAGVWVPGYWAPHQVWIEGRWR